MRKELKNNRQVSFNHNSVGSPQIRNRGTIRGQYRERLHGGGHGSDDGGPEGHGGDSERRRGEGDAGGGDVRLQGEVAEARRTAGEGAVSGPGEEPVSDERQAGAPEVAKNYLGEKARLSSQMQQIN